MSNANKLHRIGIPPTMLGVLRSFTAEIKVKQEDGEVRKYPDFVQCLFKQMMDPEASLHHAATGIAGEAGEVLDLSKKVWVYGKELDPIQLIEELGDMRYYYQQILNMLELTDEDIQAANMGKLEKRYPHGVYSDYDALTRKDKEGKDG